MKNRNTDILFTVITVVKNRETDIINNILSVSEQSISNSIEHLLIDGKSTDLTLKKIKDTPSNAQKKVISELDSGIYDALNKGFGLARGRYIAVLHSDDIFKDEKVLEDVYNTFTATGAEIVYTNVEVYDRQGLYRGQVKPAPRVNNKGYPAQIPHMGMFLSREAAHHISPPFDTEYLISADLKHQLLLVKRFENQAVYLDRCSVMFLLGGYSTSSFGNYLRGLLESRKIWNEINGNGGLIWVMSKLVSRIKRRFL